MAKGYEALADMFTQEGVTTVYGLMGDANMFWMKSVDKGANVTLVERSGVSTMFAVKDPLSKALLANPFILYLDLLDGRGRNKELAEQLRLQELGI